MIIITGGAGFIGSNVALRLFAAQKNIAILDNFKDNKPNFPHKWHNIKTICPAFVGDCDDIWPLLETQPIDAIIHMGAISDTTASDISAIWQYNVQYTQKLWAYACDEGIPFIYASSAATYGNGEHGFDAPATAQDVAKYQPMNAYGYSKNIVDYSILQHSEAGKKTPPFWAGLRFFNVYGPNEYHKGAQSSVIPRLYQQIQQTGRCQLFESHHADYGHGGQMRDFIYVKDCVDIIETMLVNAGNGIKSGIYNCGTGKARTFVDIANALFTAMERPAHIDYIPMPENLRQHYQYYTQAGAGNASFTHTSLETGVHDYVTQYLLQSHADSRL